MKPVAKPAVAFVVLAACAGSPPPRPAEAMPPRAVEPPVATTPPPAPGPAAAVPATEDNDPNLSSLLQRLDRVLGDDGRLL